MTVTEKDGQQKTFEKFTNLYELSKTLRFSLTPVLTEEQESEIIKEKKYSGENKITRQDRVEKFYQDNKKDIFEVDIERRKQYRKLKYYLTELHKLFIKDALEELKKNKEIDFSDLFSAWKQYEETTDDAKKVGLVKSINSEKEKIAKYFGNKESKGGIFQENAKKYYDFLEKRLEEDEKILDNKDKKQRKNNILLSQNVLLLLDKKIKEGIIEENSVEKINFYDINSEERNLIEYFKGWSTYFKNFNEIRGNLYKDDGRKEETGKTDEKSKISKANAGQITTRVIDENFEVFVKNAIFAEKNKNLLSLDDFESQNIINGKDILNPEFYLNCLLQADINIYNQQIGELNKFFNLKKQEKGIKGKVNFLKHLHKQLLLDDKLENEKEIIVKEFLDEQEFTEGLEEFENHSWEKIEAVRDFFGIKKIEINLDEITLNENKTHFYCNEIFGDWAYFRKLYFEKNKIKDKNKIESKENELKDEEGVGKSEFNLVEIRELLNSKDKEEFKNDLQKGNFIGRTDIEKLEYQDDLDNFENFLSYLKFYFDSFTQGRELLTKREKEDLKKFDEIKKELEEAREKGEKIDEVLLGKISEENFKKDIKESIDKKKEKFEKVFDEYKESIKRKKKLTSEKEFEFKKVVNEYCNRISDINRFIALFEAPEGVDDNEFNKKLNEFKDNNKLVSFYNEIRNFITKKKEDEEKIKLNFDVKNLLSGWGYPNDDHPKSSDFKCRLFEKEGKIYLGIVGKNTNGILKDNYQMMDYYQLKGQTIFGSVYKGLFNKDYKKEDRKELNNAYLLRNVEKIVEQKLIIMFSKVQKNLKKIIEDKKNGVFDFEITKNDIEIDFENVTNEKYDDYKKKNKKDIILDILRKKYSNKFNFNQESEYLYNRIKELFGKNPKRENFLGVDKMVYEVTKLEPYFYKTKFNHINLEKDNVNIVALFEIYNKDLSEFKKAESKKNLHTLYFEELFSEENQENLIFKLSGGAEIFFREKIEDYKMDKWDYEDLKNPETKKVPYKKRRFTENKILFHLPIALNNINKGGNVNKKVNKYIQENDDVKILGIDRGEKELVYYCLLDKDGKICGDLNSMNKTGSNIVKDENSNEERQIINYHSKLDIKEKERMMARRSWTKMEGIKDLKKGYISNVIKDITDLMVRNNALVCLEELNYGFKRGRIKIEKGIYQQFENALVDKLNYLVLKKSNQGVRNALQLAPQNRAQKYWGNQMGAIFYTDAKFTSKTCPNCGFRKRGVNGFDTPKNLREKIKGGDIKIFYEKENDRFRIEYNWSYKYKNNKEEVDFSNQDLYENGKMESVYSDVQRTIWNTEKKRLKFFEPNKKLKIIFKDFYQNQEGNLAIKENHFSYAEFLKVFHSILNIRNTIEGKDKIICPKCHFDSCSDKTLKIKNGDANGAYNIARKGLMVFEKIRSDKLKKKNNTKNGIASKDLKIILKEWDEYSFKEWDERDWIASTNPRGL